jgi:hypothetical protein
MTRKDLLLAFTKQARRTEVKRLDRFALPQRTALAHRAQERAAAPGKGALGNWLAMSTRRSQR